MLRLEDESAPPRARATIIDIARLAGVSKSTVSLVLKASPLVKTETRATVAAAMDALGYVYNRGAANLRMARSNVVGMIINDLMNPFFAELATGLESAFNEAGFVPLLANTDEDPEREARLLQSMREQGVAGLVISPVGGSSGALLVDSLRGGGPVVTMMRRVENSHLPYVGQDNVAGTCEAIRHLVALGHRRIAYFGGFGDMTTRRERLEGYAQGLREAGLAIDPALNIEAAPTRAGGVDAVAAALAMPEPPTAAVCYNDMVAIGAIGALSRAGKKVGSDFSIVGFDDIAEAAYTAPPLTTVSADTKTLGRQAAHLLLGLIAGQAPPAAPVFGPARLVARESSGPPAESPLSPRKNAAEAPPARDRHSENLLGRS